MKKIHSISKFITAILGLLLISFESIAAREVINNNLTFSKNKPEYIINNGDTLIVNGNVTIEAPRTVTIKDGGALLVYGNLTLESTSTEYSVLNLEPGSLLYVQNDLNQNGRTSWLFGGSAVADINASNAKVIVGGDYNISNVLAGNGVYLDPSNNPNFYVFGNNDLSNMGISSTPKSQSDFEEDYGSLSNWLPIELTAFTVSPTDNGYIFNWVTASEVENDYFTLEFSENGEDFIAIDYVSGAGTTSETTEYEYVWDVKLTADILYFRLKQTDYNGEFTYSDILVYAPKKSHGANRILYYGPLKLNVVDGQLQYIAE